ncbi:nitroreductase family protein [Phytohabitans sp. ZYX-F-186]|uniref:Nitroreductase family protein n=1 Tax=Phytohabitans maris TaxID=3071409 RepID=A0ABU0ZVR7_9ACTN|nr:nitroreductase family protein [Phytohabitans sp. ZYX-F-186]MDQ7910419.1 nitroreductase family protein [Phytohabitans sp. ZYX-F-186]
MAGGFGAAADEATRLRAAAMAAGRAPSILNTQPWRWRLRGDELDLYAVRSRRVDSIDPEGRLLTVSCGAALHHARVALAAAGREPAVTRCPDPGDPDLLARMRVAGPHEVRPEDRDDERSIGRRRSDRRPFPATEPVPDETLAALEAAATGEGAWLHRVGPEQIAFLVTAGEGAASIQGRDEAYSSDLHAWTRRGHASGEGVPPETVVSPTERRVPLRDFTLDGESLLEPGYGDDRYAQYLIVATDGDRPLDWLRAGEAVSAVWLAATSRGLAGSAMSDVVEVPGARALLTGLLDRHGYPQLVLRFGLDMQQRRPPASPRQPPASTIEIGDGAAQP